MLQFKTYFMNWTDEFCGAITVCDSNGIIVYMNDKSRKTFDKSGGADLIGKSLIDCHPEPAKSKLIDMLKNPRVNAYTIEKNGVKKLIRQSPWYEKGKYMGFIEMSIEIPFEMPNFVRKNS